SFYSGCCGLFVPDDLTAFMTHHVAAPHAMPPYWWGSVRLQVGVADLTCARSAVRHLVSFVHPVDRSRRFGHVSGLAVRSNKKKREKKRENLEFGIALPIPSLVQSARGLKKHLKRLNAPKHWMLDKLGGAFAPKPSSGPHKARECLPLILILRNKLKYALTYREVIAILMQRHVMVDGKVRTDKTYPAGFMGM
ncbi:hypothetical protein GW17_00017846, partial [Ensete ventricosum]